MLRARRLGFPLEDVRKLLELSDDEEGTCEQVEIIATERLSQVRQKMADLRGVRQHGPRMQSRGETAMPLDWRIIWRLNGPIF